MSSLYTECVLGFRQWKLNDWVLSPKSIGAPWRPGVNKAKCDPRGVAVGSWGYSSIDYKIEPHVAPDNECNCGLYALHEHTSTSRQWNDEWSINGAIAAWGKLQVHHDGFRAEFAQILALEAHPKYDLTEVAGIYGVPVLSRDELQPYASQFATPLPEAERPEKPEIPYLYGTFSNFMFGKSALWAPAPRVSYSISWDYAKAVKEKDPAQNKKKAGKTKRRLKGMKNPSNRQGPNAKPWQR